MENTVITAAEAKKMTEENLFNAPDFVKAMDRVQKATARGEYRAHLYIKDDQVHETLKSLGYKVVINGYSVGCGHWTEIFWNNAEDNKED